MNNDPTQNNNNNNNNDNNNNDNDFNNNISKCYCKIIKNDIFCFANFGGIIAAQGMPPTGVESCYKKYNSLYVTINKHTNYNLSIYCRKSNEKDIFCICNIGHVPVA